MIRSYRRESGVVTVEIESKTLVNRIRQYEDMTLAEFREFCTEGLELCDQMEKGEEHGPGDRE